MQYWDTSALLKLYVPEPDSSRFSAHVTGSAIYTSELARWELFRALLRKEMEQAIPPLSAEAVFSRILSDANSKRVVWLACDTVIEAAFRKLVAQLHRRKPPIVIRTMDAIHLAAASLLPAAEVVTTDAHMRAGAVAIGLTVFP